MSLTMSNRSNQELNLILAFIQSNDRQVALPEHLKSRLDQIDFADNQIRRHGRSKAAKMIMGKYNVVKSTAYKIINDALYVYNSASKIQKEYWRNVMLDMQMAEVIRCKNERDSKGFNAGMKNLIEIIGLNRDDNKLTAEMLQQHTIVFNISLNGGAEKYEINQDKIMKLSNDERLKLVRAAEEEAIQFDMVEFIEQDDENFEDE